MLFYAAAERRAGNLRQAGACLAQLDSMPEKFPTDIALAECEERVRYDCCLQRLKEAAQVIEGWKSQGGPLSENTFLYAADRLLCGRTENAVSFSWNMSTEDRFLLRNCILAERMLTDYR